MSRYKLIVLSDPVEGGEDEYNDWYSNQHLQDIVALDGFVTAQRFKLLDPGPDGIGVVPPARYLAVYEIDGDKIDVARAGLLATKLEREDAIASSRVPQLPVSSALGETLTWWCEAITDVVTAPDSSSREESRASCARTGVASDSLP